MHYLEQVPHNRRRRLIIERTETLEAGTYHDGDFEYSVYYETPTIRQGYQQVIRVPSQQIVFQTNDAQLALQWVLDGGK